MLLISPTDHQDSPDTPATNLYFLVHRKVTLYMTYVQFNSDNALRIISSWCFFVPTYLCISVYLLFPFLRHPFRLCYFWYLFATSTPLAGIVNFKAPRRKSSMLPKLFVVFLGWMWVFKKNQSISEHQKGDRRMSSLKRLYKGFGVDSFSNICSQGDCSPFRKRWKAAAKPVNCTLYPPEYRQLCGNRTSCQRGYLTASGSTC